MDLTRRAFVKSSAIGAAGVLAFRGALRTAFPFSQSPNISKFTVPLPGLGNTGIPLATKTSALFQGKLTDIYNIGVSEFTQRLHPDLPHATRLWGYYDLSNQVHRYLGGVIVAQRGTPVLLRVTNSLPNHMIIPVDCMIMAGMGKMVMDLPLNRHVTHLHGGLTPWISDGIPDQWFTPGGHGYQHGPTFTNVPGTNPSPGAATYYYPMDQSARFVWYHDHAFGITRTNAYSGIASALIITDDFETALRAQNLIPDIGAPYNHLGIPLVIQDKTFLDKAKDPKYPVPDAVNGDLWYPWEYEINTLANGKGRWDYGPDNGMQDSPSPLPSIAEVPEFFADTTLVNGAPYPILNVTEGTFRFRILNASQARFWHLNLYEEDGTTGELKISDNAPVPGPAMYQIGTEGGFLPTLVKHPNGLPIPLDPADPMGNTANPNGPFNLLLAPAERADVLIDFTGFAGKNLILYSDAPAPFPMGDPRNDYYTGDPDFTNDLHNAYGLSGGAASTRPLSGPNTRTIMRIVVNAGSNGFAFDSAKQEALNQALRRNFKGGNSVSPQQAPLLYHAKGDVSASGPVPMKRSFLPPGTVVRNLTLNEDFDEYGRLIQREGTTDNTDLTTLDGLTKDGLNNQAQPTWGRGYLDTPTEVVGKGAVEVWNIFNRTGDTHPIHFHLVNVQIIQRAQFMIRADGTSDYQIIEGTESAPDANEHGWKDTVRVNGVIAINPDLSTNNGVTTVIAKFDLPQTPFPVPQSPRTGGYEYVWHCHILEHEEHDMMRPLIVLEDLAVNPPVAIVQSLLGSKQTFKAANAVLPLASVAASGLPASCTLTKDLAHGTFTVTVPRNAAMPKPGVTVTFTVTDSSTRPLAQKSAIAKLIITNLI